MSIELIGVCLYRILFVFMVLMFVLLFGMLGDMRLLFLLC